MSTRFNPYDLDNVKDILDALERFNFHKAYYECINQLEDEIANLRQALEAVEWVQFTSSYGNYSTMMEICLWCGRHKEYGHTPDCQRQLALGGE